MARIAAIGERHRIEALGVAGVDARAAATADEALTAWRDLPSDVAVLILTPEAASALGDRVEERRDLLVTVMP